MKNITLFAVILLLVSCGKPQKKSVFEVLTTKELSQIIKTDSLYKESYALILSINETNFIKEENRAKYYDVTYEKVHDFMKESDVRYKEMDENCFYHNGLVSPCLKDIDPLVYEYLNFTDNQ